MEVAPIVGDVAGVYNGGAAGTSGKTRPERTPHG